MSSNQLLENQFFTQKDDIQAWLEKMAIKHYTIHDDLTVDVDYPILLSYKNLTTLPIQFRMVTSDFSINGNSLTSLKGSPLEVKGKFDCSRNQLTTLKYCPKKISKSVLCHNNKIKSLEGLPDKINWDLFLDNNCLTNLDNLPSEIGNVLSINNNPLSSLKGIKKVGNRLQIKNVNLSTTSIEDLIEINVTEFQHIITNYNESIPFLKDIYRPYMGIESHLIIEQKEFLPLLEKLKLETLNLSDSIHNSSTKKIKI